MTQHDFNIANNTFPAFRADLNNALSAVQSNNSGSSSPSTTTSYMQWADTSNNILKIRNSADNDWISILKTDGVQQYASGNTAALPAFSKADDVNTGILFPAADTLAISTGGTERLRIDSSGDLGVGTSGYSISDRVSVLCSGDARSLGVYRNFSGNSAAGVIISLGRRDGSGGLFDTAQIISTGTNNTATNGDISFYTLTSGSLTQKMKIDSSGKLGIGTGSPNELLTVSSSSATTAIEVSAGVAGSTTGESKLVLRSLHSSSGTTYARSEIASLGVAGGDSDLIFRTTTDSNGPQERMRIDSAGKVFMPSLATSGADNGTLKYNSSTGEIWKDGSSIRFKENVKDLSIDSGLLNELRPVSYNRIGDKAEKFGFIAEEVVSIFPQIVGVDKDGIPDSISYEYLVVPIIAEMKKLKAEILEMKKNN